MQSTGIVRKLDSLGRITLPMELRKSFDIGEREPLEIFTEEDKIIIKKYNPSRERQNGQPPPLRKQRRGLFCLFIFSFNTVFVSCCQIYKINYGR